MNIPGIPGYGAGLGIKQSNRLNKDYGEGNWSLTGGKGYAQSGTISKYDRKRGGNITVPVYTKIQAAPSPTPTPTPTPAATPAPTSTPQTVTPTTPQYQPQFDTSAFEAQISGLNQQISNLTSGFQTQLQTITSQMQQERADAAKRMEEMQGNFAQALAAREPRARVEGIRTPDKGTGGASQQQLQRRGVSGTFGRSGDRLMKISALNV